MDPRKSSTSIFAKIENLKIQSLEDIFLKLIKTSNSSGPCWPSHPNKENT